jgi:hypothetical protein
MLALGFDSLSVQYHDQFCLCPPKEIGPVSVQDSGPVGQIRESATLGIWMIRNIWVAGDVRIEQFTLQY